MVRKEPGQTLYSRLSQTVVPDPLRFDRAGPQDVAHAHGLICAAEHHQHPERYGSGLGRSFCLYCKLELPGFAEAMFAVSLQLSKSNAV